MKYFIETDDLYFREANDKEVKYVYRNLPNRAFGEMYIYDNPFSADHNVDYTKVNFRDVFDKSLLKYVVYEKDHNRPIALVDLKEEKNNSWNISEVVVGSLFRYEGFDQMILTELCIYAVRKGAICITFGCFSEDINTKQMLENGEFIYTYSDSASRLLNGRHVKGDYYVASNSLMAKVDRMAREERKINRRYARYGEDLVPVPTILERMKYAWWNKD